MTWRLKTRTIVVAGSYLNVSAIAVGLGIAGFCAFIAIGNFIEGCCVCVASQRQD